MIYMFYPYEARMYDSWAREDESDARSYHMSMDSYTADDYLIAAEKYLSEKKPRKARKDFSRAADIFFNLALKSKGLEHDRYAYQSERARNASRRISKVLNSKWKGLRGQNEGSSSNSSFVRTFLDALVSDPRGSSYEMVGEIK